MCGIVGIITKGKVNPVALQAMISIQSHRGPDAEGTWISNDGHVGLGHRRLSVIDLSERANQPMLDRSGRYVITYNGEIYNYIELRNDLKRLGSAFYSDSDTEAILEAYKQWGEACLDHFNGMFAFAIYDTIGQRLFCARDRYGEKPFLFVSRPHFFAFASEYKALLRLKDVSLDFDELRLIRACYNQSTGLDADRQTVFREIQQLLPSEAMEVDVRMLQTRLWRYWDVTPKQEFASMSEKEAFDQFREILIDSVRLRMRSDVPVGSCLSGGLDSSAIVCIVRKLLHTDGDYHTFTGRFPNTATDEWEYAKDIVKATGVMSHVVEPTSERFATELSDFLWYNELPVGSSSQYAQWCVFRLAKEHGITVLLDGQGGDEILGGYEQYFQPYVEALHEKGKKDRLAQELPEIRRRYPLALTSKARTLRDKLPFRFRYWLSNQFGIGTSLLYGLKPEVAYLVRQLNEPKRDQRFNPLSSALYQDSFGGYLTTLLRYGDRNSMAHSREVRLPFCDHRLAKFVLSLLPWYLMGEVQTKRMLRESMRGILPEAIRTRWNKRGFLPPQETWFKNGLLKQAEELFFDPEFGRSPLWNATWWRRALRRVQDGEPRLAWTIWHPFIVQSWRRYFIGRIKEEPRISALAQEAA
jgi:asparagine synthase (glutamine-hydrolysing)